MRHLRCGLAVGVFVAAAVCAQAADHLHHARPFASNLVMPQSRVFSVARRGTVEITEVGVDVAILEQVARTTMEISLHNPTGARLEAELIVPVPDGAVVRGFTFAGAGKEPTAVLLPKDEARKIYNSIVAKLRDPALLEFVGHSLIRSSVFPVEPQKTQKVRLTYENLLAADGNRIDYILPRTESVGYNVPWRISVKIKSKQPISTVYSPSHELKTRRLNGNGVEVELAAGARREPGAFRLSYLLEQKGVRASLFAYPDPKVGGGYFLLLAGAPARPHRRPAGR